MAYRRQIFDEQPWQLQQLLVWLVWRLVEEGLEELVKMEVLMVMM